MDLERIYREYFTIVYCYILSLSKDATVAEDITQETFFRAMKKLDEFRGDSSVETWLIQIAKRLYYNYADKSSRRKQIDEAQPDVRPRQESIEDGFIRKEYSKRINRILHDLNEPYKEVFMLRVYGELSGNMDHGLEPKDIGAICKGEAPGNKNAAIKAFDKMGEVAGERRAHRTVAVGNPPLQRDVGIR